MLEEQKECWESRKNGGRIARMSDEYKEGRKKKKKVGRIRRMSEESKECRKNQKNLGKIKRMSGVGESGSVGEVEGCEDSRRSVVGQDWGTGNWEGTSWKHRRDERARPGSFRGDIGRVVKWSGIECPSTNNQGENSMSILPEMSRIQSLPIIGFERV
jgi:hypothetical protein